MDPSKSSFAKLVGSSNYQVWSIKMRSYLTAQDLWDVVDLSSSTNSAEHLKSLNSKATSFIILSCEDHILQILDPNDLAANIWKKLDKLYGQVGFSARHLAFHLATASITTSISFEQKLIHCHNWHQHLCLNGYYCRFLLITCQVNMKLGSNLSCNKFEAKKSLKILRHTLTKLLPVY